MNIILNNITIENFKGFKSFSTQFNSTINNIYGENGLGKTSIADAISWCLFGKDTYNRQSFDIKHHDINGNTEKGIEVSVSLDLLFDSTQHSIKRVLKEKWVKERGTTTEIFKGNVTEYFVDGKPYTQNDYKAYIASIIDERTFRAITSPTYFTSLDWKEQRQFLSQLVGKITNEEIAEGNEKYSKLLEKLKTETIESILKSISYQIKDSKSKLSEIPVSICSLNKAMPESLPLPSMTTEDAKSEIAVINKQITELKSGNTADFKRAEINKKINFAQKRINEMQTSAANLAQKYNSDYQEAKLAYENDLKERDRKKQSFVQSIEDNKVLISRVDTILSELKEEKEKLRLEWNKKVNAPFKGLSESDKICPTCGQPLPDADIISLRNQRKEAFEKQRLVDKARITSQCDRIAIDTAEAEAAKQQYEQEIKQSEQSLQSLQTLPQPIPPTTPQSYNDILASNPNFEIVSEELSSLQFQLAQVTDTPIDSQKIAELNERLDYLQRIVEENQKRDTIANERQRINNLILEEEQKRTDYSQRLADLEREEDIARSFSNRADVVLENKINKHFSLVQWRMFRQNINGNKEPYCECYVDGTAYHDGLNSAKKIWAGVDIINTLCKIYSMNAPIIIDNAERVTTMPHSESQMICLYVSKDKSLTSK